MAAFSITYLIDFEFGGENFTLSFQSQMIPWIIAASLAYGMLALLLALLFGGFTPISVVEKGGWRATLGLTRAKETLHYFEIREESMQEPPTLD